jgi:hypothetical protein
MASESGATLLGELLERKATGEIAVIYDEVRRLFPWTRPFAPAPLQELHRYQGSIRPNLLHLSPRIELISCLCGTPLLGPHPRGGDEDKLQGQRSDASCLDCA